MKRRKFIQSAAVASAGAFVLPRFSIGKPGGSANGRLNIAMIGAGNIASMAYDGLKGENYVAVADVDSSMFGSYADKYEGIDKARQFTDFREMFDKMGDEIDAVCVNTPDHTHFVATMEAMQRGKHVCTQKPLTHNIWEARTLKKAKDKYGVVTNMAVQGHTFNGIRRTREWYEADVLGQVREVHSWIRGPGWRDDRVINRGYFHRPASFPPQSDPIPKTLDWDLWLGPCDKEISFNRCYHPKSWRGFKNFGNGQFGDWFPHIADAAVWTLDLYEPVVVELEQATGGNEWMVPDGNRVRFEFKQRGSKAPCVYYWYNGSKEYQPPMPKDWTWDDKIPNHGTFYIGDKQSLYTDNRSNNPRLSNKEAMRAFKQEGFVPQTYEDVEGGPFAEWARAIKGTGPEPGANFDFASPFTEIMLVGVMAAHVGGRIEWDPRRGVTNRPELNAYIREPIREGWEYGIDLWT